MGLFGGKKTYVSSVVYNMAGDVADRPNYLKTVIVGSTLVDDNRTKSDLLGASYRNGRGIKLRNYYRWALDNYAAVGIPQASLIGTKILDPVSVAPALPAIPGATPMIQSAELGSADFSYWAEQWMLVNHPALIDTDWSSDYDEATNKIKITFVDTTTVEFIPSDFDKNARYIYVTYTMDLGGSTGAWSTNTPAVMAPGDAYPSTTGWTVVRNTTVDVTETLQTMVTTTVSYSDARPDEVTDVATLRDETYTRLDAEYKKSVYQGETVSVPSGIDQMTAVDSVMVLTRTGSTSDAVTDSSSSTVVSGVTVTTAIHTVTQNLDISRTHVTNTRTRVVKNWSAAKVFIYRVGSGNAVLDALVSTGYSAVTGSGPDDGYLPFIPVRINNAFLSSSNNPMAYEAAKKAYKKSINGKLDDLITSLTDNPSLSDIDYAYVMFGVALNTKDQACRKYVYRFFDRLRQSTVTNNVMSQYETNQQIASNNTEAMVAWRLAQKNSSSPDYGTEAPYFAGSSGIPVKEVKIHASGSALNSNVDIRISWNSIVKTNGTGLLKVDAKAGEYWFQEIGVSNISNKIVSVGGIIIDNIATVQGIELCWQVTANTWRKLTIRGLVHRNYIYGGKYVETSIHDALIDADESDFIIPIHYNTLREMSLVDSTQVAGECAYLVLNSYKVVKQKWYQTGIFKIILAVVVVAIIYFTGGFGAASVGLLGTNAAVGAAIGLTGVAAIIAGAALNAIAAMLLVKLIQIGAVELFGEKIGIIVGTIVGFISVGVGTGMLNGQTFSSVMTTMTQADKLIALTTSVGNAVADVITAGARDILGRTEDLMTNYNKEMKLLSDMYEKNLGYGNGSFDPTSLTNSPLLTLESPDSFLQRTLMTGSDIAKLSMEMVYQFTDLSLSTKLKL